LLWLSKRGPLPYLESAFFTSQDSLPKVKEEQRQSTIAAANELMLLKTTYRRDWTTVHAKSGKSWRVSETSTEITFTFVPHAQISSVRTQRELQLSRYLLKFDATIASKAAHNQRVIALRVRQAAVSDTRKNGGEKIACHQSSTEDDTRT
jgi:hypothetical protein